MNPVRSARRAKALLDLSAARTEAEFAIDRLKSELPWVDRGMPVGDQQLESVAQALSAASDAVASWKNASHRADILR